MNDESSMSMPGPFQVGEWLAEPDLNRLFRGDAAVQLQPRVMEVLVCLAQHAGAVVSKNEIIDAVWRTTFVSANTLTRAVADLRVALGDDAREPRYIETITKRGYRLVAPVEHAEDAPSAPRRGSKGRRPAAARASTSAQAIRIPAPPHPGPSVLVDSDREIHLAEGENIIGRVPAATVQIISPQVSRRHARIMVSDGRATLEDLGSKNGTYLNDALIASPTLLVDADTIAVGPAILTFCDECMAPTQTDVRSRR